MSGVIGIDISIKRDITIAYKSDKEWYVWQYLVSDWHGIGLRLSALKRLHIYTHAAIEKPYLATFTNKKGERKQAVRTFGELSEVYGHVRLLCLQAGFKDANIVPVLPMVWMKAMLAQGGHMPGDLEGRKKVSVMRAQSMDVPGVHIDHWKDCHDKADAALICDWQRLRLERAEV